MGKIKIYTDVPGKVSKTWRSGTILLAGAYDTADCTDPHASGTGRLGTILNAFRWLKVRRHADCFVTTGALAGLTFAFLQSIFPIGRKPHLVLSAIWTYPRNNIELFFRRIFMKFAYRSVVDTFVNTTYEIDSYSKLFGIPREKIHFLPYSYRLTGYNYQIRDEGYIWAGGNGDRDYKLLIEAVRNIDKRVIINATRQSLFDGVDIPKHVEIKGVTPEDFRQYMAGCSFAVLPMEEGKLHPGGQQTFLALMKMGKAVVLVDPVGGADYIENGVNGLLVPFGDVGSLTEAINFLIDNPVKAKEIGKRAEQSVACNSEEDYLSRVLKHAYEASSSKKPL